MAYMVDGGKRKRPVFATLKEANVAANDYMKRTGEVLGVYETKRKVTHKYGSNN